MPETSSNGRPRTGVYICHCGTNIAGTVDVEAVTEFAGKLPGVVVARDYQYMCSDPGQDLIKEDIGEMGLERVVEASCSPLMHEPTFRRACADAGLNPYLFQMANIREHCSWVHEDRGVATEKAKRLLRAAVNRVQLHEPLEAKEVPVRADAVVVGAGIAGIEAALKLADSGKKVYLIEREPSIGGQMAKFDKTFPTLDCAACILTPKMVQVGQHPNIELLTYSEVEEVSGYVGNFTLKVRRKARYVDEDKCTGCGECVDPCPAEVPSEFDEGLRERKAIYIPFPQAVPSAFVIDKREEKSPCKVACPAGVNAHGYVALVGAGKFKEAVALVRERNPFPAICGRICHHPCEEECLRAQIDEPVAIAALKRFVADYEFAEGAEPPPPVEETRPEKVAIVGAGPAGLTAAFDLAKMGYGVTIFDALSLAGGMLVTGIPDYRLPSQMIAADIDEQVAALDVRIIPDTRIGERLTISDLRDRGFQAIFMAVGAPKGKTLDIPGAELDGVLNGLDLLREVNLGQEVKLEGQAVVIGGGNVAMDVARTAIRLGAAPVRIACLESREEMPAHSWQVSATEAEIRATEAELGAANGETTPIHCRLSPTRILAENGKVSAVEFVRVTYMEFDEDGRLTLETEEGSEALMPADNVIMAIGQDTERSLLQQMGLALTARGTLEADPLTLETNLPGVFAGGDVVLGPSSVVEAIDAGHEAAISIDRYLRGEDLRAGREVEEAKTVETPPKLPEAEARQVMPEAPLSQRIRTFEEVELGFTEEMAIREAQRCLDCEVCSECLECEKACELEAILHQAQDEILEIEAGTIVVATGYDTFDASQAPQYGYGRLPNVITSLEFERLSHASGPTEGEILLKDGRKPESLAILHCVGSRDENTNEYCSRVCCMYALKFAHLVREKTDAEVYELYIDMRAFGKGYEEFYDRVMSEDVIFIRGKGAEVTDAAESPEEEGKLIVVCEDTLLGKVRRLPVDMVILATGLQPKKDADEVARIFNLSCAHGGFFLEQHPKLAPVATSNDGVFIAGACQGPKDIPDAVAQGAAAAGEALAMIDRGSVTIEPIVSVIDEDTCGACKTCIALCPYTAIEFDKEKNVSVVQEALCKGCGTCVAACPAGAAKQQFFEDMEIIAEIEGILAAT